jgi:succinate dehydrogenase / fumarate reductase cytochrome b subunit
MPVDARPRFPGRFGASRDPDKSGATLSEPLSMRSADRPLSPHLQIYRWQLTSVLSILHRATGLALGAGTILLVWWLVAGAAGPGPYRGVTDFLGSWIGLALLFGWTASLAYHLCNGIRHLVWDTGHALDLESTYAGGWAVIAAAAALTIAVWVIGLGGWVR